MDFHTQNNRVYLETETLVRETRERQIFWDNTLTKGKKRGGGGYIPATFTFSEFVALGVAVLVPLVRLPPVPL